jgi:hypothetical protein
LQKTPEIRIVPRSGTADMLNRAASLVKRPFDYLHFKLLALFLLRVFTDWSGGRKVMVRSVTVVSGADTKHRASFEHFARMQYRADHADVIMRPGADNALARIDRCMPPEMQFVVRDVVRTQVSLSAAYHHPFACIVICVATCNKDDAGFMEHVGYGRRICEELMRWGYHETYHLACLALNNAIIPISRIVMKKQLSRE